MAYEINTQQELREVFWEEFSDLTCRRGSRGRILPQNEQPADTRMAFVEWIDHLQRNGHISDALAGRATL